MRDGERLATEVAKLRRETITVRDWRRVRILGASSAGLLVFGLVIEFVLGLSTLSWLLYAGGFSMIAVTMLHAFDRRLFIIKPPDE